jgi:NADH:ubiquinone oxidoreductase subunit
MGVFKNIFTWWEGATFGTWLNTKMNGAEVGQDLLGNRYFEAKRASNGLKRRWVIYAGANDASRIPPDWYGWLHHMVDDVPDRSMPPARPWEAAPTPNLTGTAAAYAPSGAVGSGNRRAAATGDYEAWSPEQA